MGSSELAAASLLKRVELTQKLQKPADLSELLTSAKVWSVTLLPADMGVLMIQKKLDCPRNSRRTDLLIIFRHLAMFRS